MVSVSVDSNSDRFRIPTAFVFGHYNNNNEFISDESPYVHIKFNSYKYIDTCNF